MKIDAHRVGPKLWIGSAPCEFAARDHDTLRHFDAVVLCAEEVQELRLPVQVLHVPLDDARPSPEEVRLAVQGGKTVHELRRRGRRVLVTCAQGVNRSSLVAAIALMHGGMGAREAIGRIRANRRPPIGMTPLSNPHFEQLLHHLDRRRAA